MYTFMKARYLTDRQTGREIEKETDK